MHLQNFQEVKAGLAALRAAREAERAALAEAVYRGAVTDPGEIAKSLDRTGTSAMKLESLRGT